MERTEIRGLGKGYLLRMLTALGFMLIINNIYFIIFFLFPQEGTAFTIVEYSMFMAQYLIWFGLVNILGAWLVFRKTGKALFDMKNDEVDIRLKALPVRSVLWVLFLCLVDLAINFSFTFTALADNFTNIFEYLAYILSASYTPVIICYTVYLLITQFTINLKIRIHDDTGMSFTTGNGRIGLDLLTAFGIISVYPVTLLIMNLGATGFFANISENTNNSFLLSDIFLVLIVLGISIYFTTKRFVFPVKKLTGAIQSVEEGRIDAKTPVISSNEIGTLEANFNAMTEGLSEREKIRDTFGKYVTPSIAREIMQTQGTSLGQERTVTFLFTDIANYTSISEKLTPTEVVEFLNKYFTEIVRIITNHKGVVNKFIGDAVFAMFNVPASDPDHGLHAVQAGIAIRALSSEAVSLNGTAIQTRIGINTGRAVVGNIGSEDRLEYTAIGDAVNVAQRLEAYNKQVGTNLLISGTTRDLVKDKISLKHIGKITVKGREEVLDAYTP
ncbi:MAG: adenylate/guanylate cyclase domain-containing protein [Spirochaetia bacterium]